MESNSGPDSSADDSAYEVIDSAGRFEVHSASGRCVMACADRLSADHYAQMLNEAFRAGYRQALRDHR